MLFKMKVFLFQALAVATLCAAEATLPDFSLDPNEQKEIVINNRILLKVCGKPISVMDVVKKMDLTFYRQYPEFAESKVARYQFYMTTFKAALNALVDNKLIIADAEEKKVTVSDGDVREELELIFGPDVVMNIDKLGMTYEEIFQLLKEDLLVRKMNGMMVRAKALTDVNPKKIRELYEQYLNEHPAEKEWVYRILSIRGGENKIALLANEAYEALKAGNTPFDVVAKLQAENGDLSITFSEEYKRSEKEISKQHKEVLQPLEPSGYSAPTVQPMAKEKTFVARLFYLVEGKTVLPPTFNEMKDKLQQNLTQKALVKHTQVYLEKLRKHYGISDKLIKERLSDDFEPIALK